MSSTKNSTTPRTDAMRASIRRNDLGMRRGQPGYESVDSFKRRKAATYRAFAENLERENAALSARVAELEAALREVVPDLAYGTTSRWKGAGSDGLYALLNKEGR
jgi:hypothetical protein